MRLNRVKLFLLSVSLLATGGDSFAQGGANHGGVAVVCRSPNGEIKTAELLDLYEAETLSGRSLLDRSTTEFGEIREHLTQKLESFPSYLSRLENALSTLRPRYKVLPEGTRLETTQDVFPVISRKECFIEQAAVFVGDEEILVDPEIYQAFSPLDRLGLHLHEAVYWLDRLWLGSKDSRRSREIVGELLSDGTDSTVLRKLLSSYALLGPKAGVYTSYPAGPTPCRIIVKPEQDGTLVLTPQAGQCESISNELTDSGRRLSFLPQPARRNTWTWTGSKDSSGAYPLLTLHLADSDQFTLQGFPFRWVRP